MKETRWVGVMLFVLAGQLVVPATSSSTETADRAALEALYDATAGEGWTDSTNWKTSAPLDEWYGVTTDADGRVTWLNLSDNGLSGAIPAALGDLSNLVDLLLSHNALTGPIPAGLERLVDLERLSLYANALTGPIPTGLGSLVNLEDLSLGANALTGPIPVSLRKLVDLRRLSLGPNALTGPIPGELGNLVNLEYLELGSNALTGPIPGELGNLVNLEYLELGPNDFTGSIPVELRNLVNLEYLRLVGELTGPVPSWLGELVQLRTLDLYGGLTGFTGPIPVELRNLVNLEYLSLGNLLTGPVPSWLGELVQLRTLSLGSNELTGPIPAELRSLTKLEWLSLNWNGLTGPVPSWLGELVQLRVLSLFGNNLTGPVPAELGSLVNLEFLLLGSNELTGPVPAELGSLTNLQMLELSWNGLTGPVPAELGNLVNLEALDLSRTALTSSLPAELGNLAKLKTLDLSYNWGLSGPLPAGLEQSRLEELDFFVTQTCAPAAWREWLSTIEFYGPPCDAAPDATIDVAVVYTPAAREAAGGAAVIEAEIDLMIAETNEAYAASGVRQRLALVARSEVPYTETGGGPDLDRLTDPSDGHLDEAHALRDGAGADAVHLIVGETDGSFYDVCGIAILAGAFGITLRDCGGITFAHELGHNMGLHHDRFQVQVLEQGVSSHPAYGYVNRRLFDAVAPQSSRWVTIMSYVGHCRVAGVSCSKLPRFSNPRQRHDGDPLGIAYGVGSGVTGPSDAAAVLDATGPAVAAWRERPADPANRPPTAVGMLPDRRLGPVGSELDVHVSQAFVDPDGDALTYTAWSSAPWAVSVDAAAARVTLTAVGEGGATIRVAATDRGGLSVSRSFSATVEGAGDSDSQGSVESDRAGLEALYDATGGTGWTASANWKTSAPLGEWYGVTTDADGRVTGVDMYDNALAGWLPPALGNLARLRTLRLGWNELTGPIPAALGNLANLEWLDLSYTELTGAIPGALGRLVSLRELDLSRSPFAGSHLTGPIPAALGNLVNLEHLDLAWNDLAGSVPARLGNLAQLRTLSLARNDLTGSIPAALGNLANLESLSLSGNRLTGPLPAALDSLASLESLFLDGNDLTGSIPGALGSLAKLRRLDLSRNALTGAIPAALGALTNLEHLDLSYTWGLSGPLPAGLEQSALGELDLFVTQTCAPAAWQAWLATIEFLGPLCGGGSDVTIDVAVVYTPAAREAAGGTAGIEAAIDLMVAETNQAYASSGVHQRVALVARSEVPYTETRGGNDLYQLADPSDDHLDEVHALRDETGADMVHLIVATPDYDVCGIAFLPVLGGPGPFGVTLLDCGGIVFAHELGHNMGLLHDRFETQVFEQGVSSHPAHGYVNQRMFQADAPSSSRWVTVMSYHTHCRLADVGCSHLPRFSNPRQHFGGDQLGVAFGVGSGVSGAADAAAVLNATGPAMAALRDRAARPNRRPVAVGSLPDRRMSLNETLGVDVSGAFDDPDGDPLTYTVSSSAPDVVTVRAAGARVTLTAVSEGAAAIRVTATDSGGLSAARQFRVTVAAAAAPFTDDPIRPGVTPVRAVHFRELRMRIGALRAAAGLPPFRWTDPVLRAGVTRVRLVHLLELREALAAAYAAKARPAPRWTDAGPVGGTTPIRAVHLNELRAAVAALE